MNETFGDKVVAFNAQLNYTGELPPGFQVVNPFMDNPETMVVMKEFYDKYYNDNRERKFIVGINPGRHGAAITGVPFTDTKRLEEVCGIKMHSSYSHEVSSVFVYEMIKEYGGVEKFYQNFYINSVFPLAIVIDKKGKWLNANYYDDPMLFSMTEDFMIECVRKQIDFGLDTKEVYILGAKNATFIAKINKRANLFGKMTILEHPRYVQQYKTKEKQFYIDKYIRLLNQ